MIEDLSFDPQQTAQRIASLSEYIKTEVLDREQFICRDFIKCRASHPGTFYTGQLHHIGKYYDAYLGERPYRIIVVAQEYGHPPSNVSLAARQDMILNATGLQKNFHQRNPHMRGVTSALRLLFGLPLSVDHESEFLNTSTEQCHIFEAFALVNYLLCSAVEENEGTRGKATRIMLDNCQRHFRNVLEILEPTIIVVQSKQYWKWISRAFERITQVSDDLYQVEIEAFKCVVAVFSHPSTPDNLHNWGRSIDTPYLINKVSPTLQAAKALALNQKYTSTQKDHEMFVPPREDAAMDDKTLSYDAFYSEMQARFRWLLPREFFARNPVYIVKSNRMHITLDRIPGSHYEICLRGGYHEIALHFQSTPERSLERRRAFDPLLDDLSEALGYTVRSGPLENRGWMRVWIERPVRPVTLDLLDEYTGIFSRFITATFPKLEMIYQSGT